MSLLAPLYFLGALAIGLPILFHLIRRRPKGEIEFSSLMFLRPTPPRLTRRSRLDNLPLLLIRALALILLAAAFTRPFLRSTAKSNTDAASRRIVLVIDTSASMQRSGLWQQAVDRAADVISDLQRGDELAIISFDRSPQTLLSFQQSAQLNLPQRKATATDLLVELSPTWNHTDIGRALCFAADLAVTYEGDDPTTTATSATAAVADEPEQVARQRTGPAQMTLISDMQVGSRIDSLQVYAWPDALQLEIEKVVAAEKTNASLRILVDREIDSQATGDRVRVRVSNSADAADARFSLTWSSSSTASSSGDSDGGEARTPVQVPPGESRVVRMPAPRSDVTSLVLHGDDHSFDNVRYLVSPQPESLTLMHLGTAAAKPSDSLLYYLERVPLSNPRRSVSVDSGDPDGLVEVPDPNKVPLVVVEHDFSTETQRRLKQYIASGGNLLCVLAAQDRLGEMAVSLNGLIGSGDAELGDVELGDVELGDPNLSNPEASDSEEEKAEDENLRIEEAVVDDYVMFSQIDFGHPLFAPMADPQFNDFTKIRIWSHRKVRGLDDRWRVLSRFDDGDPALMERTIGDGRIWILATGWQPQQSQLALSTKFIPLIFRLFDIRGGRGPGDRYTMGQPIEWPPSPNATITDPAGLKFDYQDVADLEGIDRPGIYEYSDAEIRRRFAVDLDESESRTEPLEDAELERFGVILGRRLTHAQTQTRLRQLRDMELEGRQRLWQWLLVAGLVLLALETWLGGLISRRRPQEVESSFDT